MGANPHANGGMLLRDLVMPDFRDYAVEVHKPGTEFAEATRVLGDFLRDVMKTESASPRTSACLGQMKPPRTGWKLCYEVTDKEWMEPMLKVDEHLSQRRPRGRDAERAHVPGMAGRISADRAPRILFLLRGFHPHHRLDVQPACQVAEGDAQHSNGGVRSLR